jgi:quinoprotein glucose dehydrogenase
MLRLAFAGLLSVVVVAGTAFEDRKPYTTWSAYAGSADSMQYSALAQITKTNVASLERAWFYPVTGEPERLPFNPLIVDDVMYVAGEKGAVVALNAATGAEVWRSAQQATERGLAYWENSDRSDRRLILAKDDGVREIDARTGQLITTFGVNGVVDMRIGSPRRLGGPGNSPPRIFENLLIVGSNTGEGYGSPPGDIRAYDVVSGRLVWTFHTIPRPGEYGYDTWPPDAWQYAGGANVWGDLTLDTANGIVFAPTGSPTHDLYGADRAGANLFGNCLLALDARTGRRRWHFQAVHHDLWDYDLASGPKLLTVRHDGRRVNIVAVAGKTGFLYVFERLTGKPLWPIDERPVPKSEIPGEASWPTQPFPIKPPPFARQRMTPEDINRFVSLEEQTRLKLAVREAANTGLFTPSSHLRWHIQFPGAWGGANWGSTAADPTTGMLFVRSLEMPSYRKMALVDPAAQRTPDPVPPAAANLTRYPGPATRYAGSFSAGWYTSNGYPAVGPPWTQLVAYDLNDGTITWRVADGQAPGIAEGGGSKTGTVRPRNGPVVTAGGLVFVANSQDRFLRAYDAATGRTLWEHELDANPEGIPAVYEVAGRQYIAFAAGASWGTGGDPVWRNPLHRKPGSMAAQGYHVFALPR